MRALDLTDQRFGLLVAKHRNGKNNNGRVLWRCLCDCGNIADVHVSNLRTGETKSCGCLSHLGNRLTHGHRKGKKNSLTYSSWCSMKKRCYDKTGEHYEYYGGRGIVVCDRWVNSFENFLEDMGERPKGLTLERNNNDGNYEPTNCKWATKEEQARNKRNNKFYTFQGVTATLSEWARRLGVGRSTLHHRKVTYGWSIEKTLTTPLQIHNKVKKEVDE